MRILIADASKAGLVMTSELFKDHFPGVQVAIARTSSEVLEAVDHTEEPFDLVVVDYDLPDTDGIATAAAIKERTPGPVVITAVERDGLGEAIEHQLAPYLDCCHWLKKPLRAETTIGFVKDLLSGAISCERRVPCGALTWATFSPPKKSRLKPACLPVVIEDVSHHGFRLRLSTDPLGRLTAAHKKSFHSLAQNLWVEGQLLELHLPVLGQNEAQEKELRQMWRQGALGALDKATEGVVKKTTLSGLGKLAKGKGAEKATEKGAKVLGAKPKATTVKAQVVRIHSGEEEDTFCVGVHCQEPSRPHVEAFFHAVLGSVPTAPPPEMTPAPTPTLRGIKSRSKTHS